MALPQDFIPCVPFSTFKWKWACLTCTEGLNDPVILLGVLFRMRKLELLNRGLKYSSPEFAAELDDLSRSTSDSIGVNLSGRTGSRNLIRNSGQYWRGIRLIEPSGKGADRGKIELTPFGRDVADRKISQGEFAAITIRTFRLPNDQIQGDDECAEWKKAGLELHPLLLLLSILLELHGSRSKKHISCAKLPERMAA